MPTLARVVLACLVAGVILSPAQAAPRPATMRDVIAMTLPRGFWSDLDEELFEAPGGEHFAVLVNRGDLAANVRRFELWLFDARACLKSCAPKVVARGDSPDNFPGLDQVRWAGPGALVYLGRDDQGRQQAFRYDLASDRPTQLTRAGLGVRQFDVSADGRKLVYMEHAAERPLFSSPEARSRGVEAGNLPFVSLVRESGQVYPNTIPAVEEPGDLVFVHDGGERRVAARRGMDCPLSIGFEISPDGRSVLTHCFIPLTDLPEGHAYLDPRYSLGSSETLVAWIFSEDGTDKRLVDTPYARRGSFVQHWTADGRAVILHTLAPPGKPGDPAPTDGETVEVDVQSGARTVIAAGRAEIAAWAPATGRLVLTPKSGPADARAAREAGGHIFLRGPGGWRRDGVAKTTAKVRPRIVEDYRTPPRLVMASPDGGVVREVLDFNPQLNSLALGEVRSLSVTPPGAKSPIAYGLYFPVGYKPGTKYPVVIQTHGWDPKSFQMDGESSAGYAAQVLAGKGFVVVQSAEAPTFTTPAEGPENMALFEAILDDLDHQGVIDPSRIGIQAWSRTGVAVRWTLVHSKYRFAAALLVDSMSVNYMEYLTAEGIRASYQDTLAAINGGSPIGRAGLQTWAKTAPAFNFDDLRAAVKIVAFQPLGLSEPWEDYVVLKHLGKPVELTFLPDSNHWPLRPAERITVQDGAVDWWAFWLMGEKDPDPAKADQYRRWEALRAESG